jgi:hypothetical protein
MRKSVSRPKRIDETSIGSLGEDDLDWARRNNDKQDSRCSLGGCTHYRPVKCCRRESLYLSVARHGRPQKTSTRRARTLGAVCTAVHEGGRSGNLFRCDRRRQSDKAENDDFDRENLYLGHSALHALHSSFNRGLRNLQAEEPKRGGGVHQCSLPSSGTAGKSTRIDFPLIKPPSAPRSPRRVPITARPSLFQTTKEPDTLHPVGDHMIPINTKQDPVRPRPEFVWTNMVACFCIGGIYTFVQGSGRASEAQVPHAWIWGLVAVANLLIFSLIAFGIAYLLKKQSRYKILNVALILCALPFVWLVPYIWAFVGRKQRDTT